MKKFKGILICTDLDGTLLRNDKSISKENLNAIEYFKSEGGLFTFSSGRMPYFADKMYDAIRPNAPIGCINGGGIYDFPNKKYLWAQKLTLSALDLAKYVFEHIEDMGIHFTMLDTIYFYGENSEMNSFRKRTGLPNNVCSFDELDESPAKLVFCHHDHEKVLYTMELLRSHPRAAEFDFIRSEATLCEILPKGSSKGNALRRIADIVGVDMNRVIAIGDYDNDISMIQAAKIGVAVANALPEVKAVADHITVSNEENAIAKIIYDIDSGILKI